jgi:hypothetical protein
MKIVMVAACALLLTAALAPAAAHAQRTQTIESAEEKPAVVTPRPAPPPKVVSAKYMGGFAGYKQKREGMLTFDDRNSRLVFRDKNEKEILSIPYAAVKVAFADSETRRLMGDGTKSVVLGTAGIFGLPAMLLKKKFEYVTIEFEDPDTYLQGVTQFKIDDKAMVESVTYAIADKAGLMQRGQIFVRRRKPEEKDEKEKTSSTP